MIKRIKVLIFGVIIMFSFLISFNLYRMYAIKHSTTNEIENRGPSYQALNSLYIDLLTIKDIVTQAGLTKSQDEISDSIAKYATVVANQETNLQIIQQDYLSSIQPDATKETVVTKEKLTKDFVDLTKSGTLVMDSSKQILENALKLAEARKTMSKEYRAGFSLSAHQDAWAKLSRAVITVISSQSNKDIAYSGRALFSDATNYFDSAKLSNTQQEAWTKIKTEFLTTLELALQVSSTSEDNQLGLFRDNVANQLAIISLLKSSSENAYKIAQTDIVTSSSLAFRSGLVASIFIIALSIGVTANVFGRIVSRVQLEFGTIQQASQRVKNQSKSLLDIGSGLSMKSRNLSSGIEKTASAVHEIKSMIESTEETSRKSQANISQANQNAGIGERVATDMEKTIQSLNQLIIEVLEVVAQNGKDLRTFNQLMSDIREKTSSINEIVFQTKLLSFNASVEAARAGDHGKGFAVVAEEIGALARLSGDAANEINHIIESSEKQVIDLIVDTDEKARRITEKTKIQTNESLTKVKSTLENFTIITRSVRSALLEIQQISTATSEQAKGIVEVNSAVLEFNNLNSELSDNASSTSGCAQTLGVEANQLEASIAQIGGFLIGIKSSVDYLPNTSNNYNIETIKTSESPKKGLAA